MVHFEFRKCMPLTGWDKIDIVLKRKHSATCLVKYYNNFLSDLFFAPKIFTQCYFPFLFVCTLYILFLNQHYSSPYYAMFEENLK